MPNIYQFDENQIILFSLILVRVSAFIVTWPILGSSRFPTQIKILFSLSLAFLFFTVQKPQVNLEINSLSLVLLVGKELLIGVILGFMVRFIFFCFQVTGEIVSITMGLSSAQVFNPQLGGNETHLTRLFIIFVTIFYLSINGHHYFLQSFAHSFDLFPIGHEIVNFGVFSNFIEFLKQVMIIGFKMSVPILSSIFFINISMAILGKAVPQINVLITSLPVNILVGFVVFTLMIPVVINDMPKILDYSVEFLFKFLKEV